MKYEQIKKRPYKMQERAKSAADNEHKIMDAVLELWKKISLKEITLDKIAEHSGVTVRTILRKFGSREELLEACIERESPKITEKRNKLIVLEPKIAVSQLVAQYEETGDAMFRTILLERELPMAKKMLNRGRQNHKEWCSKVFEQYLPDPTSEEYPVRLATFIAATEIYLWKLLRKDLNLSFEQTVQVFIKLVNGALQNENQAKL